MNNDCISVDTTVIGAGVIGLAVARQLAMQGHEVIVLEQEPLIGSHTSSRNSEVIHAGLYYPENSLKARHCVEGKHKLYEFCRDHQVNFHRCGKLIVATNDDQYRELQKLKGNALRNGVLDLELIHGQELQQLEPELNAKAALLSPSTGILDCHSYMLALQGDLERHGGHVVINSTVTGGKVAESHSDKNRLMVTSPDSEQLLESRHVINCAGLFAAETLKTIRNFPTEQIPVLHFAKGNYFSLQGPAPFSHLIYPVPTTGGLGVHLTLDLAGQARFGPDVQWLDHNNPKRLDYHVSNSRENHFYEAIGAYWPGLKSGQLTADYCGIRPKLAGKDNHTPADFRIDSTKHHGIRGWINLFGIESPGLTASLSLADAVCNILART